MSMLKIKIKRLPSWDTNAGTPLMIRLPSQVSRPYCLLCTCWSGFFFLNLEGMYLCLVWCSLFWQDLKLCWKPCFSRAVPQRYLRGCVLCYSPPFGWTTTPFYSYYSLVINYLHRQCLESLAGYQINWPEVTWMLLCAGAWYQAPWGDSHPPPLLHSTLQMLWWVFPDIWISFY